MRAFVRQQQARQLLHNKFVVVLGGSVQRSVYKDLVLLLQRDQYLTLPQLKSKGEFSFEQDSLVEGGQLGPMTNGTDYREVRQYRSDHHLLRFYFLTRIYSPYMESILEDFRRGLKPDFIIVSSCVWDITRYGPGRLDEYKENLHRFFGQIQSVVCCDCLILWSLAMPLGKRIRGGFLVPEVSYLSSVLCRDVIEANFYSSRLARAYGLDVLDLHFHFRLSLQHRMPDSIHWDALAHRRISSLLLQHAAHAWGVDLPHLPATCPRQAFPRCRADFGPRRIRPPWPRPRPPLGPAPRHRQVQIQHQQSLFRGGRFRPVPLHSGGPRRGLPPPPPHRRGLTPPPPHRHGLPPPPPHRHGLRHFHPPFPRHRPPPGSRFPPRDYYQPPPFWWPGPRLPRQVRGQRAGPGFRFHPHFRAGDGYMRRTRPTYRTHPYPYPPPPPPPWGAPRPPAYGWW